jgi:hypothetical protein
MILGWSSPHDIHTIGKGYRRIPERVENRSAPQINQINRIKLQNLIQALIDIAARAATGETIERLEEVNPDNPIIAPLRSQAS